MTCDTTIFLWSTLPVLFAKRTLRSENHATSPNRAASFALSGGDVLRVQKGEAVTPFWSLYSGALPIVEGVSPGVIGHEAFRTLVDGNGWDDKWVSSTQEANHSKQRGGEHLKAKGDNEALRPGRDYSCPVMPFRVPARLMPNMTAIGQDPFVITGETIAL